MFKTIIKDIAYTVCTQIGWKFYLHTFISFLLTSISIPLLDQYSIKLITDVNTIYNGIKFVILMYLIEILIRCHNIIVLEPLKIKINAYIKGNVELIANGLLEKYTNSSQRKLFKDDFYGKKSQFVCSVKNLFIQIIDFGTKMISIIGYSCWIMYNSPYALMAYIISYLLYLKFVNIEVIPGTKYKYVWTKYNKIRHNHLSELVHMRGKQCHKNMAEITQEIEELQSGERSDDTKYTGALDIMFLTVTIINIYIMMQTRELNSGFIIIFLQYLRITNMNLRNMIYILKQYKLAKKDFDDFIAIFKDAVINEDVGIIQLMDFRSIIIKKNSKYFRENKLALHIATDVILERGAIVCVTGGSGAGKTTFFDIVAAMVNHNETKFEVWIDGIKSIYGFSALKANRIYVASDFTTQIHNNTIFELVTSNRNYTDMKLVNKALDMAECLDFVKGDILHKQMTSLSKGQDNRLKVAKYIYDILLLKPEMILLDEIADGVEPEITVKIAEKIYNHSRQNKILTLITTHFSYLKDMNYDRRIMIDKGILKVYL
jgi:ABC-type multidrug transport system ATPase subunit